MLYFSRSLVPTLQSAEVDLSSRSTHFSSFCTPHPPPLSSSSGLHLSAAGAQSHILQNLFICVFFLHLFYVYLYDCVFAATRVWTASVSSQCTISRSAQFVDSLEVRSTLCQTAQKSWRRVCIAFWKMLVVQTENFCSLTSKHLSLGVQKAQHVSGQ